MGRRMILMAVLLSIAFCSARAQKLSVSTNALGYADFLTINAEASVAVARHWSVNAGFMYNPWSFRGEWGEMRDSRRTASAGTRFWFWNVYSGWWLGAKVQWEEYNRGGIRSPRTEEGDAFGAGLSAGYSLMLHRNINLDFGLGFWSGYKKYTVYSCPTCGRIDEQGAKAFILPNDVLVSLMFTF